MQLKKKLRRWTPLRQRELKQLPARRLSTQSSNVVAPRRRQNGYARSVSTDIAIAVISQPAFPQPKIHGSPQDSPIHEQPCIPAHLHNPALSTSAWVAQHFTNPPTGKPFLPNAMQAEILDCPEKRIALLCSRQYGKTAVIALKALHHMLHHSGATLIVLSVSERQSSILLKKLLHFAQQIGLPFYSRAEHLRLANHSNITALPGSAQTTRGISAVDVLIIDEAAFAEDELFHACTPFLATTNGHLWLLSTANGQSGFFYDIITSSGHAPHDNHLEPISLRESGSAGPSGRGAFESGSRPLDPAGTHGANGRSDLGRVGHANPGPHDESAQAGHTPAPAPFAIFIATADQAPRITPEFLSRERALKPAAQFEREYHCKFLPTRGQIFDAAILRTTGQTTQGPLAPTLLFGLDIGFQQSHTALAVLHLSWSHQGQDPITRAAQYQPHLVLAELNRFPLATAHQDAWATIDRTIQRHTELVTQNGATPTRVLLFDYAGAGQVYFEHFKKNSKGTQVQPITITSGNTPSVKSDYLTIPRQDLLNTLKVLLENNTLQIPPGLNYLKELMDELKGINLTNTHRSHDDLAIALSLAAYRARVQMTQPPTGTPKGRIV